MADYHVDLAFNGDCGAIASIYDYQLYPLQQGLVEVGAGASRPAWYTKLKRGDGLAFSLYDISARPGRLTPSVLVIDFRDPGDPERLSLSPFGAQIELPLRFERSQLAGPTEETSAVFGTARHWQVDAPSSASRAVYELVNPGKFLMNAKLTVEDPEGARYVFAFDPEVIVGGGEGPGG